MEEIWGKIKNGFINNIFIIIVGIACLAYICYGIIDISETGKSITQILMDGAIAFLFATFIIKLFDIDALKRGSKIQSVIVKQNEHEKLANEVAEYCDLLDKWCIKKNKLAYITARTRILEAVGIKYSDYENNCIDYENLTKQQKQAIRKANKVKITKLSTNYLLGETAKTNDPHNIGRSKVDYERNVGFTSMFSRIATMVIAGYYSVDIIASASLMDLAWAFVQVVFFLLMGGLRWGQTFMYMNDEYPSFINGKINFLKEFKKAVENNELEEETNKQHNKIIIKQIYKKEKKYGEFAESTRTRIGEKENEQENIATDNTIANSETTGTDCEQCNTESSPPITTFKHYNTENNECANESTSYNTEPITNINQQSITNTRADADYNANTRADITNYE